MRLINFIAAFTHGKIERGKKALALDPKNYSLFVLALLVDLVVIVVALVVVCCLNSHRIVVVPAYSWCYPPPLTVYSAISQLVVVSKFHATDYRPRYFTTKLFDIDSTAKLASLISWRQA